MKSFKVQIDYNKHNRTLFSCANKEDLSNENNWSEVAYEEGWAMQVIVKDEHGETISDLVAGDWGGINLDLDLYKDEIEASNDKYFILKDECWGGGNSKEADGNLNGDEGEFYEVEDLKFKPLTVRLGLIEDIINESGDIIGVGDYTGLQYDIPEESIYYYELRDRKLIDLEYDEETNTWQEV